MHLLSPKGFRAGAVSAGIKSNHQLDLAMLVCDQPATASAVFTTNRVVAAPVIIGRENLREARGKIRAIVVNSGNANACTGARGKSDARETCSLAASRIDCDPRQIIPSSTGIIGHALPMQKIRRGIEAIEFGTSSAHALQFADAILTTDTKRKTAATRVKIERDFVTIAGACKGSGMIGPKMELSSSNAHGPAVGLHATMLAFLTTDAQISAAHLNQILQRTSDRTFNAVTVDGHMSTNDTAIVLASGMSGQVKSPQEISRFRAALDEVCQSLAYQIAADGEGATKVVRIIVESARSDSDAKKIARAIADSPLVKCAMHGNDPNWGRIVSAAGYSGATFDPDRATLKLQQTCVFHRGRPASFDAKKVSRSLHAKEVLVELSCNLGKATANILTCDLSKDYVTINADYHT